ncbi:trypsin alpha-3-like [Cloeon dipterum]|uniref:trypsin alpha-3-like n=1 Tax=Cloeon dipterum TaxID=197152 RepID=UPI00321FCB54
MNFLWSFLFFAAFCAESTWVKVAANPFVDRQLILKDRIIGGTDAREGEVPWQVSLHHVRYGFYCGGTIVDRNFIITAAHCSKYDRKDVFVFAGSIHKDTGDRYDVSLIVVHPRYDLSSQKVQANDIAVWKMKSPFSWSENIKPAGISFSRRVEDGWLMTVSGWGKTKNSWDAMPSNYLKKAEVRIVNREECRARYQNVFGVDIPENTVCAGGEGKDTCNGDSGGPLVKDGVLYGVVSFGVGTACGFLPGGYTEVALLFPN